MDRADTTLSKEVRPVLLRVVVEDAVLEIIRKKILDFDWSVKPNTHVWIDTVTWLAMPARLQNQGGCIPRQRVFLVKRRVHLKVKRRRLILLLTATGQSPSRPPQQVLPEEPLRGPRVPEALIR